VRSPRPTAREPRPLPLLALLAVASLLGGAAAQPAPAEASQPTEAPSGPLAEGTGRFLGSTLTAQLDELFPRYWNQVTPEDAGKWLSVEGQRGTYTWGVLDVIFMVARAHGLPVKQHTFVWGQQEPHWVAALPPDEQRDAVERWIRAFAERYPDVDLVDVVNEPLHAPPSYVEAIGGAGETGWDWVVWSFERAREALPHATLLINEYNILCCAANRARYAEIVELLLERGLIDGIGVQAHGLEHVDASVIAANLDALASLGLPIYVSELDLESSDDAAQLAMYQRVFPVLWEHEAVAGVTLWGYRAGRIWKRHAFLLDWFDEERPALRWLAEYVRASPYD
jgi:endo-1,4-beta-xylanase